MLTEVAEIMFFSLAQFSDTSALSQGKPVFLPHSQNIASKVYGKTDAVNDTKPALFIDISTMKRLGDNYFRLASFRFLKKGWDGYQAETIPETVLSRTQNMLLELQSSSNPKLQVFPTGRRTVQIEYFIDDDNQIEVEVFQNHYNAFVVVRGDETEKKVTKKEAIILLNDFIYEQESSISNSC